MGGGGGGGWFYPDPDPTFQKINRIRTRPLGEKTGFGSYLICNIHLLLVLFDIKVNMIDILILYYRYIIITLGNNCLKKSSIIDGFQTLMHCSDHPVRTNFENRIRVRPYLKTGYRSGPGLISPMVLILDGSSEIDAHLRSNRCYLTCLRHLIRTKAFTYRFFFSQNSYYFYACATSPVLPSSIRTIP